MSNVLPRAQDAQAETRPKSEVGPRLEFRSLDFAVRLFLLEKKGCGQSRGHRSLKL